MGMLVCVCLSAAWQGPSAGQQWDVDVGEVCPVSLHVRCVLYTEMEYSSKGLGHASDEKEQAGMACTSSCKLTGEGCTRRASRRGADGPLRYVRLSLCSFT